MEKIQQRVHKWLSMRLSQISPCSSTRGSNWGEEELYSPGLRKTSTLPAKLLTASSLSPFPGAPSGCFVMFFFVAVVVVVVSVGNNEEKNAKIINNNLILFSGFNTRTNVLCLKAWYIHKNYLGYLLIM